MVVAVGDNGQGKTNLLEAIYFLSHAKSFRISAPKELISWAAQTRGVQAAEVEAAVQTVDGQKIIGCRVAEGKRLASVNGKRVKRAADFYGQLRVVEFTPDDLELVKGGPAERRRFLDRLLSIIDPTFVEASVSYERALRHRNALLRSAARAGSAAQNLESWEEMLSRYGRVVSSKRQALIAEIAQPFSLAYHQLTPHAAEEAGISYQSEFQRDATTISHEEALQLFRDARVADERAGRTTRGVQRDDLLIELNTGAGLRTAKLSASQGQTRSLVLALKLAAVHLVEERTGETPIVLLDDIESELDQRRREALFSLVRSSSSQVFLTTTELSSELSAHHSEAQILRISGGTLLSAAGS